MTWRVRAFSGLLVLLGIAWALSTDRKRIPWRVVLWGVALQFLFALVILKTSFGAGFFEGVSGGVRALLRYADAGGRFLFGNLVGNEIPVGEGVAGSNDPIAVTEGVVARSGAFFAFHVLPTIIFVSSVMAVLYHLRVMQGMVKGVAWVMQRTMRTSGAETLCSAANIFVGLMEAPLVVKPFVARMTNSELMVVMTAGMATVSGGTLAAYAGMLSPYLPNIAGHLIAASVMSAPAAILLAKLMVPEEGTPETARTLDVHVERPDVNVIDAAARGAAEGLRLALAVGAMLIAFIAIVSLLNAGIGWMGGLAGVEGLTMQSILGWALRPVAWLVGVSWVDAGSVGELIGMKTVLNEFVAYVHMTTMIDGAGALAPRSVVIATYGLAGFANFGSVAMILAGLGEMAPDRRHDLARMGIRAMIAGTLAALMTAAFAGMLI
ncbi:MAG: NupC/NupG family nucleoside CNT transporter [Gemmatimonadota bacterium]|nr:NupC/NupG family nucleoside CNT transporter [Gemmatimonadota bacterium]